MHGHTVRLDSINDFLLVIGELMSGNHPFLIYKAKDGNSVFKENQHIIAWFDDNDHLFHLTKSGTTVSEEKDFDVLNALERCEFENDAFITLSTCQKSYLLSGDFSLCDKCFGIRKDNGEIFIRDEKVGQIEMKDFIRLKN